MVSRGKFFICIFVLLALLVIPALMVIAEEPVSSQSQTDDQEKDSPIGDIINQVREYREAGKFEEALKQLNIALEKFPQKEYWKKLQIERASLHYLWALSLEKKYDYANAIRHYEMAYAIDKNYRPHYAVIALNNIGFLYNALGQNYKSLDYFEKALHIIRKIGDRAGEAITLNSIGAVYSDLGQKQKALEYFEKTLSIFRAMGDRAGEATTLNNIGEVYYDFGQKQKALASFKLALLISSSIGNKSGVSANLKNIGAVYNALDEKQKALEYYEKALEINQDIVDLSGKAAILNNIGVIYYSLGLNEKALKYYEEALLLRQKVNDKVGELRTLNNMGAVYFALKKNKKALKYYTNALMITQKNGVMLGKAAILNNIGIVYYALKENKNALEYMEKALIVGRTNGDLYGEVRTLNNIGLVYESIGNNQKALEYYEKALPISWTVSDLSGKATTLRSLMLIWEKLNQISQAIIFGKQSVNTYQKLRKNISGLEKEIKINYLENKKDTYRELSNLLITEGRISEAQQVLDMLKEEEYFKFIRRDRSFVSPIYAQMDFTKFERQWINKYNTVMENLSTITSEYHSLKIKNIKNNTEKKRMEELGSTLEKSRMAYHEYLIQLKKAFAEYDENIKKGKYESFTLAKHAKALQSTLRYLDEAEGGKNAALHYMVFGGRVTVILTTPDSQLVKSSEIDEKKLNRMIIRYRMSLRELDKELQGNTIKKNSTDNKIFQNLYDVIFKPIDEELTKYGATNLMIFLDGVLRYIPLAALWDGKSYLVQRYRMTLFTTSSLARIENEPGEKRKILGLGASRGGSGFKPLPNVKEEIQSIVKDEEKGFNGFIKGKALIDSDFTKDTLVKQLKTEDYPLVHISSHFKFSPGDETKNYLLMGDGSIMNLSEIRYKGNIFDKVELLVLAACETGIGGGNGQEIDGFGELAQQSGAKSVLATLWKVRDKSTKELMVKFYRILKDGKVTSKIEALRQAQLQLAGLDDLLDKNNPTVKGKRTKYAHPYYWGPFIMIGNWR